jgi:prevent-host-death family protein
VLPLSTPFFTASQQNDPLIMSDTTNDADRRISATEARSGLSGLISRAKFSEERTILTRHGEPAAALVSMKDLKTWKTPPT